MVFTKAFIVTIYRILSFFSPSYLGKHGDNFIIAFASSVIMTISLETLNNLFFKDANLKNVWIPIVIEAIMIGLYFFMTVIDNFFGRRVAIKVRKEKYDPERYLDTIAKMCAIIIMTSLLMFFCMLIEVLKWEWLWVLVISSLGLVWFLIIIHEFSSIGRHYESLYGSKPGIFIFMDNIKSLVERKAIKKIDSSFNFSEDEKDNNSDGS